MQLKNIFNKVGWFIPSHIPVGILNSIADYIEKKGSNFSQEDLQKILSVFYSEDHLSAMVADRYSTAPHIMKYKIIISESIEAYFLGLSHIAVSGILPAIEGTAKENLSSMGFKVPRKNPGAMFVSLAGAIKERVIRENIGDPQEISVMLDSFASFAQHHLYKDSSYYLLSDKTNRHGILHGNYSDEDYGNPVNFYKCIASINFLCFISTFHCFAPDQSTKSQKILCHYNECRSFSRKRPVNTD